MTEESPEVHDLQAHVAAVGPHADTPAELLGLVVGAAYGNALADVAQAREVAERLGLRLAEACQHLEAVLPMEVPTFAHEADDVAAAREWLARNAVPFTQTPEQEV